jgi:hypothetical protein
LADIAVNYRQKRRFLTATSSGADNSQCQIPANPISIVHVEMRGILDANGPGSTGKSSPGAAAPSPKGNTGGSSGDR